MLTRPFSWFLAPAALLLLSAASSDVAGEAKWTLIKTYSGEGMTSALFVESPVMRSADKSLTVVHVRTSFAPALKGADPTLETKTLESVEVFDCQNHEFWSVYLIGLPAPALRVTAPGHGERRQIIVENYDSDVARETDWRVVPLAAFACK